MAWKADGGGRGDGKKRGFLLYLTDSYLVKYLEVVERMLRQELRNQDVKNITFLPRFVHAKRVSSMNKTCVSLGGAKEIMT